MPTERIVRLKDGSTHKLTFNDWGLQTSDTPIGAEPTGPATGPVSRTDFSAVSSADTIRPETQQDVNREWIAPLVKGGMVNYGRLQGVTAGTALGGPPGGFIGGLLGGMSGSGLYQLLQQQDPKSWGAPPENAIHQAVLDPALDLFGQGVLNKTQRGLSYLKNTGGVKNAVAEKFLGHFQNEDPAYSARFGAALRDDPNFPVDAFTATQNPTLGLIRNALLSRKERTELPKVTAYAEKSVNKLLSEFAGGVPTTVKSTSEQVMEKTPQLVKGAYDTIRSQEKTLHTAAEGTIRNYRVQVYKPETVPSNLVDPNGNPLPPTTRMVPTNVEGPITLTKTSSYAEYVTSQLDHEIELANKAGGMDPETMKSIETMKARLKPFIDTALDANGNPTVSYITAKQSKGELYRILDKVDPDLRARYAGQLETLGSLISKDMKASIGRWDDPLAKDLAQRARGKTLERVGRFGSDIAKQFRDAVDDVDVSPEKIANAAINNGTVGIQNYLKTGADVAPVRAELARRIFDRAYDPATGTFKGSAANNAWNELRGHMDLVTNNQQRSQAKFLMDRLQLAESKSTPGETSVKLGATRAAFYVSGSVLKNLLASASVGGIAGYGSTGNASGAMSGAAIGAGTYIGAIYLGKKVLEEKFFDPQFARALAELAPLNPTSPAAALQYRKVFNLLNGVRLEFQNKPFIVEDGKLVPAPGESQE
jgi:hypothetical protein